MNMEANISVQELSYAEAIRDALDIALEKDSRVILMGEDIGVYGGAFQVTGDLVHKYGTERVIDTPISELGGAGVETAPALEVESLNRVSVHGVQHGPGHDALSREIDVLGGTGSQHPMVGCHGADSCLHTRVPPHLGHAEAHRRALGHALQRDGTSHGRDH